MLSAPLETEITISSDPTFHIFIADDLEECAPIPCLLLEDKDKECYKVYGLSTSKETIQRYRKQEHLISSQSVSEELWEELKRLEQRLGEHEDVYLGNKYNCLLASALIEHANYIRASKQDDYCAELQRAEDGNDGACEKQLMQVYEAWKKRDQSEQYRYWNYYQMLLDTDPGHEDLCEEGKVAIDLFLGPKRK